MPKILENVGKQTEKIALAPRWESPKGEVRLYHGHVVDVIKRLPARLAHCIVTSPPYWGLRDYGTGSWIGGDTDCDHIERTAEDAHKSSTLGSDGKGHPVTNAAYQATVRHIAGRCAKCGATRTDQQIGMEDVADCLGWATGKRCGACFVCHMVDVFRAARDVLRDDGTLWLNLGDTFDGGQCGVPWRTALALQADGWILVQDIIWAKPNPMPESVENRCSKSHEYFFILAKTKDYFFDNEAIKEPAKTVSKSKEFIPYSEKDRQDGWEMSAASAASINRDPNLVYTHANKKTVWTVATRGYPGAHFAVFSPELITPCILAGTSAFGCCAKCGTSYKRVVQKFGAKHTEPNDDRDRSIPSNRNGVTGSLDGTPAQRITAGWKPQCVCNAPIVPCVVMDPFSGSGTTCATAVKHGRHGVGIDLSEKYIVENAIPRIEEALHDGSPRKIPDRVLKAVPPPVKKVL